VTVCDSPPEDRSALGVLRRLEQKRRIWVASPELAAEQIYTAIRRRKRRAYIARRWILVAWLMRLLPNWLYRRLV
jgi:short-subunit dehydrogenase